MITENYLQIMIDSLLKKIEILKKVSELNEQQSALLDDKAVSYTHLTLPTT